MKNIIVEIVMDVKLIRELGKQTDKISRGKQKWQKKQKMHKKQKAKARRTVANTHITAKYGPGKVSTKIV